MCVCVCLFWVQFEGTSMNVYTVLYSHNPETQSGTRKFEV